MVQTTVKTIVQMKRPMPRCVVLAIESGRAFAQTLQSQSHGRRDCWEEWGMESKKRKMEDGRCPGTTASGHRRLGAERKGDAVMQMRETQATDSLPLHRMKPQRGLFRTSIKEGRSGRYFWLSRERRSTAPACGDSLPLTATLQQCLRIYFHNFIEPLRIQG